MKKLLMGNEAIALGAMHAGVCVVTGYPGTPSTEILETVAKENNGSIYVEWSVNEKVALEVAAGASYAGVRSMVTMKQVGLNVASDPLMSLVYVGIKGGMVVVVADDPGPLSSQTEQDTRHFGKYANIPVFDPSSPEEAYQMIQDAFAYSEKYGIPVFFRPTTRVCHSCATVDVSETEQSQEKTQVPGFEKDPRFVIFPSLTLKRHSIIEEQQEEIAKDFSNYPLNQIINSSKSNSFGIIASGISAAYAKEVIHTYSLDFDLLKIATPFPLPKDLLSEYLKGKEQVLVIEELDPVIEEGLIEYLYQNQLDVKLYGKKTGHMPKVSEFSFETVKKAISELIGISLPQEFEAPPSDLPIRPPVLCAGCPHRASFYAVKTAMKGQKAVFTGDIGCYTLGNAKPLEMCDTCLCMGASVTIAQGLQRAEPDAKHIGFIGDSTFFHTGIPGVINALYNNTDMTLIVLDNSTTAMTGHQPHPGIGVTMMKSVSEKIDIEALLKALHLGFVKKVNPFDQKTAIEVVKQAAAYEGVSAVIFEAPCIALFRPEKTYHTENCKKCGKCIREIGCPAMSYDKDGSVAIEQSLCYGCGLCKTICPFEVIV